MRQVPAFAKASAGTARERLARAAACPWKKTRVDLPTCCAIAIKKAIEGMLKSKKTARIDYVAVVDNKNLKEVNTLMGETLIAIAVFIGKTRLIDNVVVKIRS